MLFQSPGPPPLWAHSRGEPRFQAARVLFLKVTGVRGQMESVQGQAPCVVSCCVY